MMSTVTSDDAERRLAEALRAQAVGGQRPGLSAIQPVGGQSYAPPRSRQVAPPAPSSGLRTALLLALLAGAVLGAVLALMSLWMPGMLPPIG